MKHTLKKTVQKLFYSKNREIFTELYLNNSWNSSESVSGEGSTLKQTETLRQQLPFLLKKYNICSILDLPCGDFNWMKELDMSNFTYVGGDIVKELINKNNVLYSSSSIKFKRIDIIQDKLPKSDLVIVRDCFVHLTNREIYMSVRNIKKSKSLFLLTTTFEDRKENPDTQNGGWRPINLLLDPFNFQKPIEIINENCTEGGSLFKDKSMSLFRINELPDF